jgi:uncharacterized protein DUF4157
VAEHTTISPAVQAASLTPANELTGKESVKETNKESLQQLTIQCKLAVGAVDDPLESEADAMADKVMSMPKRAFIQKKCAHCEEEKKLQRKPLTPFIQKKQSAANSVASDNISSQIQSTQGNGTALPDSTKSFMESRFGADFSNVNIHTGNHAIQMSKELNAQAFTVENDIYFNEGKYQPESSEGQQLLAHELTHVVQQENVNKQIICRQEGELPEESEEEYELFEPKPLDYSEPDEEVERFRLETPKIVLGRGGSPANHFIAEGTPVRNGISYTPRYFYIEDAIDYEFLKVNNEEELEKAAEKFKFPSLHNNYFPYIIPQEELPAINTYREHAKEKRKAIIKEKIIIRDIENKREKSRRSEIILVLPLEKNIHSMMYDNHVGWLQHQKYRGEDEFQTNQISNWTKYVKSKMSAKIFERGLKLGLDKDDIIRPYWTPIRIPSPADKKRLPVDHKIEWQVRPILDPYYLDQYWNYELLDPVVNSSVGPIMRHNIEKERVRLSAETQDLSWLYKDLTFTKIETYAGPIQQIRWTIEDVIEGKHLDVYEKLFKRKKRK